MRYVSDLKMTLRIQTKTSRSRDLLLETLQRNRFPLKGAETIHSPTTWLVEHETSTRACYKPDVEQKVGEFIANLLAIPDTGDAHVKVSCGGDTATRGDEGWHVTADIVRDEPRDADSITRKLFMPVFEKYE